MSIAPLSRPVVYARKGQCYLTPFNKLMAPVVAAWVQDDEELLWLAPKTPPPLTAQKVIAWPTSNGCPLLFCRQEHQQPLGYLEVNPMPGQLDHVWLGHCLIDPDYRYLNLGKTMIALALQLAFDKQRADRVSLVVFPKNVPAVRCYHAVGFLAETEQVKYFATTDRHHRMLQMSINRHRYDALGSD